MPDPISSSLLRGPEFLVERATGPRDTPPADGAAGFGDALLASLQKLDGLQQTSDAQSQALATGQAQDVAQVVLDVERASLAIQLASQVRNKAVDAYHELFRMQI